jgi:hypothetical protein
MAHRYFFKRSGKFLSEEDHAHHKCHNKLCVNPDHIQPKPQSDHMKYHNPRVPIPDKRCEECDEIMKAPGKKSIGYMADKRFCGRTCANRWNAKVPGRYEYS